MAARSLKATDPKSAKPSRPKILVFGKPGVGKTWTALEFPQVYYIDTEGGANLAHYTDRLKASGGVYFGPEQGSLDFHDVIDEVITLATTKHPYKTLVIDSFSKLFQTKIAGTAQALDDAGKKNEFGADRKPAVGLTRRLVHWIDKLDMNCVLICHEKAMWKDGEQVGVTFDGYDKLEYELHLALNITKAGPARKARVTKSRLLQFPDAETFDWSYASFADRFGRAAIDGEVAVVALASPEQITRYNELLALVKIDPKVTEKWAEACPDLADLTLDDMQKRIDWLTAKLK